MHVSIFGALPLALALGWVPSASAQQSAAQRCLDAIKPVLRNDDGSLSPNPAFDECLRNPLITAPAPVRPAVSRPQPVAAVPVYAASAASNTSPQLEWRAMANVTVESTIRSWLPTGWQLKWDTKEKPRGVELHVKGEFLDAMKALAGSRRQWTDSDGGRLQVLVFKADRIVQVRDANTVTDQASAAAPVVRTESLSGANP